MKAVWVRARAELRARWRAWLGLAAMIGALSGVVFAAAAGARRTDTALGRFADSAGRTDVIVPNLPPPAPAVDLDRAAALPQVARAEKTISLVAMINDDPTDTFVLTAFEDPSPKIGRPKVLEGRLPAKGSLDEIAVSTFDLKRLHSRLGALIAFQGLPGGSAGNSGLGGGGFGRAGEGTARPVSLMLRVVGIIVAPGDFPTSGAQGGTELIDVALANKFRPSMTSFSGLLVRLRGGNATYSAYAQEIGDLVNHDPNYQIVRVSTNDAAVQRSFHLQAVALWILAGTAGIAMLVVFAQLLARNAFLESQEFPTMRALGMTGGNLVAVTVARAALMGIAAMILGVAVAFLLSPILPIGNPRLAEPHPGFAFDAVALLVGATVLVVVILGVAAVAGFRLSRAGFSSLGVSQIPNAKPSIAAGTLARASMPASAVAGVRLALEPGHGRTALPVRSTLVGVGIGLAALVGALTFGSSLRHLVSTPRLYGVGWDTEIDAATFGTDEIQTKVIPVVKQLPGVSGFAVGDADVGLKVSDPGVDPESHGIDANALVYRSVVGSVLPSAITGRLPGAAGEIALGEKTIQRLHKKIGEQVAISIAGGFAKTQMRIVGIAVVPPFSATARLGQGSIFSEAETAVVAQAPPPGVAWVRFSSPAARSAGIAAIQKAVPDVLVYGRPTPNDIVDFGRMESLPLLLAGLLALLSAATLAHAIITAVRRRRRDLAILKTLGFVRAQVRRTVGWQASALAVVAMVVAVPVGVVVGRALWDMLATQLGIAAEPETPLASVLLVVPATLALALGIAVLPARLAARTKPALVLRTE